MSYLDRIAECNNADLSPYRPFLVGGSRVGWIRPPFLHRLAQFPEVFCLRGDEVILNPDLDGFDARTEALDGALRSLVEDGAISGWRGEKYPVSTGFSARPLLAMERAATPLFGVRAYGVHINGYVRRGHETLLWIARRARDKPSYPAMLDNFVAGGQPIGMGLLDNVIKECAEEADVPRSIAESAVLAGAISYCHEIPDGDGNGYGGVKPDVMFVYDLELPADFTPRNTDGEIDEFYLWPLERAMEATRETADFKFNCALANIDFFVRRGALNPETEPDYMEIVKGLRR